MRFRRYISSFFGTPGGMTLMFDADNEALLGYRSAERLLRQIRYRSGTGHDLSSPDSKALASRSTNSSG